MAVLSSLSTLPTRALITGGAGFIGSHLAENLLERGCYVHCLDDLSTGSITHLESLKQHPRFSYTIDTMMNRPLLAEMVDWADMVFHLAAAVGVELIVKSAVHTIETNIRATELVLELAAKKQKTLLLTSTSEVYGKLDQQQFREDSNLVLGPTSLTRWSYAASKIIDEFLAQAYFKEKDLPVIVVRLFNIIGPRQTGRYGMVVPRFVQQALAGEPITVYGDGSQRRSFTWVGDAVRAIVDLSQTPNAYGEVFNLGHVQDISIAELAALVKEKTASTSEITTIPYERAYQAGFEDMHRRLPDISKIQQFIQYQPTLELPEMIDRIIAFHQAAQEAPRTDTQPGDDYQQEYRIAV